MLGARSIDQRWGRGVRVRLECGWLGKNMVAHEMGRAGEVHRQAFSMSLHGHGMQCYGGGHEPPTPAALATVALIIIIAVLLSGLFTGCQSAPDRRVQSPPAWTNAAPYEGARGPSW